MDSAAVYSQLAFGAYEAGTRKTMAVRGEENLTELHHTRPTLTTASGVF